MDGGNFSHGAAALILLSGMPGAGKTTFARVLSEVLSFEHVESDAIRRSLGAQPAYSTAENALVFARAEAQARAALEAGRHVVLDATNLSNRDRKRFVRLARKLDATLVPVRVTAPEETVRERLRQPREGFSQAGPGVYDLMRGRGQLFSVPVLVVDTRFDLRPSIDLVLKLIEAEAE